METIDAIELKAKELGKIYPKWRKGQVLFNALFLLNPEIGNKIRKTREDCFYNDEKIPVFMDKVRELWTKQDACEDSENFP